MSKKPQTLKTESSAALQTVLWDLKFNQRWNWKTIYVNKCQHKHLIQPRLVIWSHLLGKSVVEPCCDDLLPSYQEFCFVEEVLLLRQCVGVLGHMWVFVYRIMQKSGSLWARFTETSVFTQISIQSNMEFYMLSTAIKKKKNPAAACSMTALYKLDLQKQAVPQVLYSIKCLWSNVEHQESQFCTVCEIKLLTPEYTLYGQKFWYASKLHRQGH